MTRFLWVLCMLIVLVNVANAKVYKWIDAKGQVQF